MTEITLLDGGMGQELIARAGSDPGPLWATRCWIMMAHTCWRCLQEKRTMFFPWWKQEPAFLKSG